MAKKSKKDLEETLNSFVGSLFEDSEAGLVYEDDVERMKAVEDEPELEADSDIQNSEPAAAEADAEAEGCACGSAEESDEISGQADEPQEAECTQDSRDPLREIMTGEVETDGALTLARYASRAYLEYAMSVVKSRALPEVTDGQKPVQRRILIDMERMGLKPGSKAVKSARVVGDVLGKYHPHGDQSVYDAMVRMAQTFSLRYPLVSGHGNFGSRDGDGAAAMRYTEARLMPISELLLDEVDSGAVDFAPNYDGNFVEPVELPAKLPFVLLNGSSGIAVGMATEIPSHNLCEVADAVNLLIENPEAGLDELMQCMPAPDFPCGGQIISSRDEIREIYRTGRGKLRIRARYHFEELARGQWQLVVDELPPMTSAKSVLDRIELITNPKVKKDKKTLTAKQQQAKAAMLALLDKVRDESGRDVEVRLVFEPKSSRIDRNEFLNALLSQTDLEGNVPVNFVMIGIDGRPEQKTLKQVILEWIEFRRRAVEKRTRARLEKVDDRLHVLEGRRIVLLNVDRVIEVIRTADDPKAELMAEFGLTERQADDILEIRLRQLARLAAIAIEKEYEELSREKSSLERLLSSEKLLRRQMIKEVEEAKKKFGDARRTLVEEAEQAQQEQTVADEPVTVVVSKKGFVRCRTGHGFDCSQMGYKMGDEFWKAIECRSVDSIIVLDDHGRVYTIAVKDLPGARGDGLPLTSFIEFEKGSEPVGFLVENDDEVLLSTDSGFGFVAQAKDMSTRLKAGRAFIKLDEGAKCLPPQLLSGRPKIAALSDKRRLAVFDSSEVRRLKGGKGVVLLPLAEGEKLVKACPIGDDGCRILGVGVRSGKVQEAAITRTAFAKHTVRRGRLGRAISVSWKVTDVLALEDNEGVGEAPEIDDMTPKLL